MLVKGQGNLSETPVCLNCNKVCSAIQRLKPLKLHKFLSNHGNFVENYKFVASKYLLLFTYLARATIQQFT
jgi:hypothetical protein